MSLSCFDPVTLQRREIEKVTQIAKASVGANRLQNVGVERIQGSLPKDGRRLSHCRPHPVSRRRKTHRCQGGSAQLVSTRTFVLVSTSSQNTFRFMWASLLKEQKKGPKIVL